MESNLIEIRKLNLQLEKVLLMNEFNFILNKNERIGITGPSGCGKSTFIKSLIKNKFPSGSKIDTYIKVNPLKSSYIPQNSGLLPWFSLKENIFIFSKDEKKIDIITETFNLKNSLHNFPSQLSGGEYQRATLLTAIINNPTLFIADEPLTELDLSNKWHLLHYWSNFMKQKHSSLILVSHDIETLLYLCDKIIVLSDKPSKVISEIEIKEKHPRTKDFITSATFMEKKKILLENLDKNNFIDVMQTDF